MRGAQSVNIQICSVLILKVSMYNCSFRAFFFLIKRGASAGKKSITIYKKKIINHFFSATMRGVDIRS